MVSGPVLGVVSWCVVLVVIMKGGRAVGLCASAKLACMYVRLALLRASTVQLLDY